MKKGNLPLFAQSNLPESTMTPPMEVPWPPIHLVADSTTMSAPCSMGRHEVAGGAEGVVDDEGDARARGRPWRAPRSRGRCRRVADGLDVDRLGLGVDGGLRSSPRSSPRTKLHADAEPGQGDLELVVGAAVERGWWRRCCRRPGRCWGWRGTGPPGRRRREAGHAALERGDPLLEDVGGGVHDAGVDVAELLEREEVGAVLGGVEDVGGGLVDGHRARLGGGSGSWPAWTWSVSKRSLRVVGMAISRPRGKRSGGFRCVGMPSY